jgi:hypothetical protein
MNLETNLQKYYFDCRVAARLVLYGRCLRQRVHNSFYYGCAPGHDMTSAKAYLQLKTP